MPRAQDCRYTKDHEWVHLEGDEAVVGITDFAQKELGDIVYADLGETGRSVAAGDEIGTIESVKAVAEIYAPVAGDVLVVNEGLADAPELLNSDPLGEGWLMRLRVANVAEVESLMNLSDYQAYLEEEGQ